MSATGVEGAYYAKAGVLYWREPSSGTVHDLTAGGVGALDDLTDVTISGAAEDDALRYNGSVWINDPRRWEPVTTNPGGGPELVWTGDDIVMTWRSY